MAKPTRHGDKWRIRWFDAAGKRQSAVFDDFKTAQIELGRSLVQAEEVRKGLRDPDPGRKGFGQLCDYWIEKRAPRKRSKKDDESIIRKHLRPYFGAMCVRDIGVEEGDDYLNLKIDGEGLSDKYASTRSFRLLFSAEGRFSQVLLSLSAFAKKTQKTPVRELERAEARLRDWRHRGAVRRPRSSR